MVELIEVGTPVAQTLENTGESHNLKTGQGNCGSDGLRCAATVTGWFVTAENEKTTTVITTTVLDSGD